MARAGGRAGAERPVRSGIAGGVSAAAIGKIFLSESTTNQTKAPKRAGTIGMPGGVSTAGQNVGDSTEHEYE